VNSVLAQEPETGLVEMETPEQKIARLEKMILELRDANNMFMENLAGCMEENEAIRNRVKAVEGEDNPSEDKYRLIENVKPEAIGKGKK
jgi:hypothetical protein